MKSVKKRNTTLDMLRIILAALVVYIHLSGRLYDRHSLDGLSLVADDIILIFARIAVPLFFAISGYCLWRNSRQAEQTSIKRSLRHLALLIIGTVLLYVIVSVILDGPFKTASRFTPSKLFGLIMFNQAGVILTAGMMWFLLALVMCYLIYCIYPYISKRQKYLLIIAVAAYFWAISISPSYGGIIMDKQPAILFRNYISLGLPFFTLGYFCHKYQTQLINNLLSNQAIKFFALSFVLYFIEQVVWLSNGHRRGPMEISIMMPMLILSILTMAAKFPNLLSKTKFPKWSTKYSLYLYIGHTAVLNILAKLLFDSVVPKNIRYYKVLLLYVLAVAITLLVSFIYLAIKSVILRTISKYHAKKPTLRHWHPTSTDHLMQNVQLLL